MNFQSNLSTEEQISLYKSILLPRMIEEKMLILLRQGKISKWFAGIGQEAIAAGIARVLDKEEYILPMHRNLGVFTNRDIPLYRLFAQWQGKAKGFTQGRDRSFHFGTNDYKIVGMISHLGPQLGVACGIALAEKLDQTGRCTAVFTGEGGTSEGDFHEALNLASVWQLPVIFCIENNGYGLSTPTNEQYNCDNLIDRAKGYGMDAHYIDGNNIIEVYNKLTDITKSVRQDQKPVLIEFKTFRRRGHEEASGTKYVPKELMEYWEERDPISNYEAYLKDANIISADQIASIRKENKQLIDDHLKQAFNEPDVKAFKDKELAEVYQDHQPDRIDHPRENINRELRFIDAIKEGLHQAMKSDKDLILMGQDIAEYGGVFKITEGFVDEFGKQRVRNTPICESVIISTAMGLSIQGKRSVVELQFGDFVSSGFNPIVNYLAKTHYRWGQNADVVLRMPCGAGVGAGPFHSQTNEAWFTKVPGLKVVYPAFPDDAKGLLISAVNDPNPVMYFEHKALYRSIRGNVDDQYYEIPIGKAKSIKQGRDISIITYGAGVHWAIEYADDAPDVDFDILDLRSLQPLDFEAIEASLKRTGKVIVLQEDTPYGGVGAEVASYIAEHCFEHLDAPVRRVNSMATPVPFASALEDQYLPLDRLNETIDQLIKY